MSALTHSVVICVHNALDELRACLSSVLDDAESSTEIICVDDASDTETAEYLRGLRDLGKLNYLRTEERRGYTKAANMGLAAAKHEVITLLNSDTIVPRGWSVKTLRAFADCPEIGVIGPLSNAASYQSVPSTASTGDQTAINALPSGISISELDAFCERTASELPMPYVPLVHGFCMSISRKCLEEVGLFDETSFPRGYGEESDFCIRAIDAGYILAVLLRCFVFHAKSKSYSDTERVGLMRSGWEALVAKHGRRRLARSIRVMEENPALVQMRRAVGEFFADRQCHTPDHNAITTLPSAVLDTVDDVKVIAFYLPQFHPIPINDKYWGRGFTEWHNVAQARPRFKGHQQPRLPADLGFYDLRRADVMREQAELASRYGVYGMCMYYYRLSGGRLLETPAQIILGTPTIRLRFCYCWANESWTRAWDGASSDVLLRQTYDEATLWGLIDDLTAAVLDDRYICVAGRPLFIIYQAAEVPDLDAWVGKIREEVYRRTRLNLLVGTNFSTRFRDEMLSVLDFVVQFPPHRIRFNERRRVLDPSVVEPFDPERGDYYESYDDVVAASLESADAFDNQFLGVCPDWDNTPRRRSKAHTLIGSTPDKFRSWVEKACAITRSRVEAGHLRDRVIFVNAWNEWAEGAVLEPSVQQGVSYLLALSEGIKSKVQR